MLINKNTGNVAKKIITEYAGKLSIADGTIELLTNMLKNENTADFAKEIIKGGDFTGKIKSAINFQKLGLQKADINELLNAMSESGDKGIIEVASKLKSDLIISDEALK